MKEIIEIKPENAKETDTIDGACDRTWALVTHLPIKNGNGSCDGGPKLCM